MGGQVHFHMLPKDRDEFLGFIQERAHIVITNMVGDSPKPEPAEISDGSQWLCLWNKALLPQLERIWVPNATHERFRIDETKQPVLEFSTSFQVVWDGNPSLVQGRIYGIFEEKPPDFRKWYETLARWIRRNFRRNPTGMGGYVAPAAFEFFENGGYLLPNFLPPETREWIGLIGTQHSKRRKK